MASTFFKRLAKATTVSFGGQTKSTFGSIAAVTGGISYLYYYSSPNLAHLDEVKVEGSPKVALNPDKWVEFKLQDTARVSHNTHLFRFSFDPAAKLGLDIASCIITRAPIGQDAEGKTKYVVRPYTPISDPDSKGYFDLLIKVYPEGKMSQHFATLKSGDVVEVKGLVIHNHKLKDIYCTLSLSQMPFSCCRPIEKLRYSPNMKKHIGMIAGGTGITPMLQVIEAILKNPDDNTQVSLLYANVSPDDILLKQKLDFLSASHPNLKIFYTVDDPSKNWKGGSGYISKDMVVKGLPGPSDDTLILVCGPSGMMKHISGDKAKDYSQGELTGLLKEAGYTEEMVYKF
uniref:NADH-cytochrome b5 reductase n=1 Tax=Salix viminalis TaxID=40686 RepID=A0A6N2L139_SALVM